MAFDSLGRHLLSLDASVDDEAIGFEGLKTGSRTTMYWGPFPALLRIIPNLVFPSMYGQWSRSSCLLAALLSLLATVGTTHTALTASRRTLNRRRIVWLTGATVGFALGTPVVYLLSCSRIYHESILWGLCGSLCSIFFVVRLLSRQITARWGLFGLACSFGVTLLARVTFAAPVAAALALLAGRALVAAVSAPKGPTNRWAAVLCLALAVAPALVAGAFQLWYNYDRFGTIWEKTRINSYIDAGEIGGVFNARRLPSAADNYFGLTTRSLSPHPPFFQLARVRYADDGLFFGWKEETLSLSLGSSWLVLGAVGGVVSLIRRPRALPVAIAFFFAVQALIISAYYMETQRFAAEYIPLLTLLFALWLSGLEKRSSPSLWWPATFLGLAGLSAVATVGSALQWNQALNVDVPREYKFLLANPPQSGGPGTRLRETPNSPQRFEAPRTARFDDPHADGHDMGRTSNRSQR